VRVALFATCLADALFPRAAQATVVLLERLGHEVTFPAGQTCCGQMHVNTGYRPEALTLVRHHVEVFEQALADGAEAVVAPSGSCVGSVRHQHADVARRLGEAALAERAEAVAARTCNSLRMLRVGYKPLRLLRAVRGLDLVELEGADQCCGFGGTFAIKNADTSTAMLADKMRAVAATRAEVLTAGDSSCLMHIGGGMSRLRAGTRTVHLAEILAGEGWEAAL